MINISRPYTKGGRYKPVVVASPQAIGSVRTYPDRILFDVQVDNGGELRIDIDKETILKLARDITEGKDFVF
jgi:hypothetical protein